jgi:hypothetical protein
MESRPIMDEPEQHEQHESSITIYVRETYFLLLVIVAKASIALIL